MQGTVYAIRCKETGEQYIGSTCKHAEYRLEQHRQKGNKTCSRAIIDRNNYELVILEKVLCDSKMELLYRERYYIESEPKVVNKSRPVITEQERKKAVLDYEHAHKEYYKAYRDAHKDKWMAPYSCHCGITCSLINKNRHERSIQHKDRVANLISNSFAILVDEC